ncbi:hypothetical protein BKI52_43335 [marine bacterium AO1-C]|nr:hypothetical protein BKI52_43335 [marine bacterium AO1-C]
MKVNAIIFFIILCSVHCFAQAPKTSDIVIGKKLQIKSVHLKAKREVLIYLPPSYGANNYTKYPVLYLLDGRKFFHSFTGAIAQLSSDASPQIPEMIVVGITSQDRIRDSSPTNSLIGYNGKKDQALKISGGADNFLKFIKNELIPLIDKKYRTNTYRTFTGYSFTGLPVLHALFTMPQTFSSYLIIDFSAWWDQEVMLKNARSFLKKYKDRNKDVFIATNDRVDNVVYPEKYNATWRFIQAFEQNRPATIGLGFKKYPYKTENHHSMPLRAFMEGLKYIFRGYMINYDEMYSSPQKIATRFEALSHRLGYKICLPEGLLRFFGYQFLYAHPDLEKATFYFKHASQNYPQSDRVWVGLAKVYQAKNDKGNATKCYQKALTLNPKNKEAQKQLKALK